jgi:PIN domain nuclease of toxin-antitoxin system
LNLLLDTCTVIHVASRPARLSVEARRAVSEAGNVVFVSVVTVGELACWTELQRLALPVHWKLWFRDRAESQGWNIVPVTLEIMEEAFSLPGPVHGDPVDRILLATARLEQLTLVTTDRLLLEYPHAKSLA